MDKSEADKLKVSIDLNSSTPIVFVENWLHKTKGYHP